MANREDAVPLFNVEDLLKEAWAPKPAPVVPRTVHRTRIATALSFEDRRALSFSLLTYIQRCRDGRSQFD